MNGRFFGGMCEYTFIYMCVYTYVCVYIHLCKNMYEYTCFSYITLYDNEYVYI